MRIGILSFLHESNTFVSEKTTRAHFEQDILLTGQAIRDRLAESHHEVGGFFEGLRQHQMDAVPLFAARALPFGTIVREAYDSLIEMMLAQVERAGSLDGYLVAPHGATVSESQPDADGYWLQQLRQRVGDRVPIVCTLDLHANLSPAMTGATDAIVAYRTNPHLDQRERGIEAATILARTLAKEIRPTQSASMPRMAMNIECQRTDQPPCLPLYDLADPMREQPGVVSVSILQGFPYADVAEMGSAALVVTNGQPELAQKLADELGDYLWTHRETFAGDFIDLETALDRAMALDGPVCLLDMGDNVGGGSPADGTLLAHAIHNRRIRDAFVCIYDAESVREAEKAGAGNRVTLKAGGKTDDQHGPPLELTVTVLRFSDGQFKEPEPRHGGIGTYDQGRTALVRTDDGLTLMLTTRRMAPVSLHQLTHCGVDPQAFRLIVAKGVNSPVAAYQPVCSHLIRVNTPGVTTADIRQLTYRNRRRPMFPFESRGP